MELNSLQDEAQENMVLRWDMKFFTNNFKYFKNSLLYMAENVLVFQKMNWFQQNPFLPDKRNSKKLMKD